MEVNEFWRAHAVVDGLADFEHVGHGETVEKAIKAAKYHDGEAVYTIKDLTTVCRQQSRKLKVVVYGGPQGFVLEGDDAYLLTQLNGETR